MNQDTPMVVEFMYTCQKLLTTLTIESKTCPVLYRLCIGRRTLHDTWINYLSFKVCIGYKWFQNLEITVTWVFCDVQLHFHVGVFVQLFLENKGLDWSTTNSFVDLVDHASVVKCWLTLDWHSVNISTDAWSTLDWHLNQQPIDSG